jgi:hypothetical protein
METDTDRDTNLDRARNREADMYKDTDRDTEKT